MNIIFILTFLVWLAFSRLIHKLVSSDIAYYLLSGLNCELHIYDRISLVLSSVHAVTSLCISCYLYFTYSHFEIESSYLYHMTVALSIGHYITDLAIVGYLKPDLLFILHHVGAIVVVTTFYNYNNIFPHMYSLCMILAEITNPIHLVFNYLLKTKQYNSRRFFVSSTIFTYLFTFIRCIIVPIIYYKIRNYNVLVEQSGYVWANLFTNAMILSMIGNFIWTYGLVTGYYKKIYLPLTSNKT